jgi:transposase InsO family protein
MRRYILTAIDTVSKIAFARMYTTKSSRSAADFLRRVFYLLDGSMLNALHDNGSEFHKEFQKACEELHITQYWSRERPPTDNSVNERFNRTVKEEFLDLGNFTPDPNVFNPKLTEWLIEYAFTPLEVAHRWRHVHRWKTEVGFTSPVYGNSTDIAGLLTGFTRPHQTLGYDTPWEFYQKTAKVLPMYSSRTTA